MNPVAAPSKLRTLLILARASNIPTVWSNCLAGWILGGSGHWLTLLMMCIGASFLYIGGMFLNDAFDASFDTQYRKERPIPSGAIRVEEVWILGGTWLVIGLTFLFWMGLAPLVFSFLLVACILFYNWIHKKTQLSPLPMAACRFLLYLLAASTANNGVDKIVVMCAIGLACYVVGLSYVAKTESAPGVLRWWPCLLLAAPFAICWHQNRGDWTTALTIGAICTATWILFSVSNLFRTPKRIGATVSGLLAGIVLIDLLNTAAALPRTIWVFVILFVCARIFQRFIPAT